jgi:hypothetical protein
MAKEEKQAYPWQQKIDEIVAEKTKSLERERDELRAALDIACNGNRQDLVSWLIENEAESDRPFKDEEKVIVLRMIVVHHIWQALDKAKT